MQKRFKGKTTNDVRGAELCLKLVFELFIKVVILLRNNVKPVGKWTNLV